MISLAGPPVGAKEEIAMPCVLTPAQLREYEDKGFVIKRRLFDAEEVELLKRAMAEDPEIKRHALDRADGAGGATRISLWNRPGDSVYGLAARSARMVDTWETILGGEVYHFQSKLTAKEPFVGGAWEWHQDYGYWYYNGCLFPTMGSCMVALDRTTRDNGCLQIIEGSHKLGRLDHVPLTPGQNEADPEHIKWALTRLPIAYIELEPGDACFFHCNTLHRSEQNRSPDRRWTLIYCYNRADNDTFKREDDRYYVPLNKVPDDAIKRAGVRFAKGDDAEHFASKPFVPDTSRVGAER
jgi:hypothetical protein